jgi:hypothetical protein
MQYQLEALEKIVQNQNSQIMAMASKLQSLLEDVRRVQQFDAKIRVMMNLDREPADTSVLEQPLQESAAQGNVPLHRQDLLAKRMHSLVDQIAEEVNMEEFLQQKIILSLRDNREFMVVTPSIWAGRGAPYLRVRLPPFPLYGADETACGD